jgi:hypothetical protein
VSECSRLRHGEGATRGAIAAERALVLPSPSREPPQSRHAFRLCGRTPGQSGMLRSPAMMAADPHSALDTFLVEHRLCQPGLDELHVSGAAVALGCSCRARMVRLPPLPTREWTSQNVPDRDPARARDLMTNGIRGGPAQPISEPQSRLRSPSLKSEWLKAESGTTVTPLHSAAPGRCYAAGVSRTVYFE